MNSWLFDTAVRLTTPAHPVGVDEEPCATAKEVNPLSGSSSAKDTAEGVDAPRGGSDRFSGDTALTGRFDPPSLNNVRRACSVWRSNLVPMSSHSSCTVSLTLLMSTSREGETLNTSGSSIECLAFSS